MRFRDVSQEFADRSRRLFRLLDLHHVRRAGHHGEACAGNRFGDCLNDGRRRGLIEFAGDAQRRHADRKCRRRQRVDVTPSRARPPAQPSASSARRRFRAAASLPRSSEFRREPALQRCLERARHAVALCILAARARDHLAPQASACWRKRRSTSALNVLRDISARASCATMPPNDKPATAVGVNPQSQRTVHAHRRHNPPASGPGCGMASAVAALIDAQNGEIVAQYIGDRRQKGQVEADRMQQGDTRPSAGDFVVQFSRRGLTHGGTMPI